MTLKGFVQEITSVVEKSGIYIFLSHPSDRARKLKDLPANEQKNSDGF